MFTIGGGHEVCVGLFTGDGANDLRSILEEAAIIGGRPIYVDTEGLQLSNPGAITYALWALTSIA